MLRAVLLLILTICSTSVYTFSFQNTEIDTVKNAAVEEPITLPKESLHTELYLVAPGYEYIPGDETPEIISSRLSCIEQTIPLKNNKTVHAFIQYFTVRDREYSKSMLRKKELYFPIFEKYLAKYNLPDELKYLSIIESGLNPRAVSRAKAVGLWQFMPYTGKHYGLTTDWYWDDRMDPEKSTDAACRLLADLYRIFKNWDLALAAYNSGPGTVLKANKRSGYKNDFWEVYPFLPRETRSYVPQFIAIVYTMKYAEQHNLFEPFTEEFPLTDTLNVKSYLNIETLANLTGSCLDEMHFLNPALKTKALPNNGKWHTLKIPLLAKEALQLDRQFILDSAQRSGKSEFESYVSSSSSEAGKEVAYYIVKAGDGLGIIANRYGLKQEDLKNWNNLSASGMIHPGQRLKVWVKDAAVNKPKANVIAKGTSPEVYIVQNGDSLWDISKKFEGLTIEKIKALNSLPGDTIKPGQKLVLR